MSFPPPTRQLFVSPLLGLLLAAGGILGCHSPSNEHTPRPLDTVEVGAGATSGISHEGDDKAVRRDLRGASEVAGVLPGGFPEDLPLPTPSSVVDFGDRDDRWVELSVPRTVPELRVFVERRWASAGWVEIDGGWERGDRRVEVVLGEGDRKGESRLRVAYR